MPTAKELFEKYMKFDNNENDHKCISMFGYTATEIVEALEFWGKAKDALEALGLIKFKEPEELPIFEVRYPSGSHTYKIWASGRTEGFNKDVIVINRIPQFEAQLIQKYSK